MKKTKIIIPALGILLLSTAASVTGTVAWFAMNESVTASGMQVKAVAEDGILICNEGDADSAANWKQSTDATFSTLASLAPTSTSDFAKWYHNSSTDQNNAQADKLHGTYINLATEDGWKRSSTTGAYFIDADGDDAVDTNEKSYVLLNKFYIKSSGSAITLGAGQTYTALYVNKVVVGGASATAALDASLRIGIQVGTTKTIYAPVSGATTTYYPGGNTGTAEDPAHAETVTAVVPAAQGVVNTAQSPTTIPAITAAKGSTIEASIYIYFEGEDAGLKSANLAETLDTLTLTVQFGITAA